MIDPPHSAYITDCMCVMYNIKRLKSNWSFITLKALLSKERLNIYFELTSPTMEGKHLVLVEWWGPLWEPFMSCSSFRFKYKSIRSAHVNDLKRSQRGVSRILAVNVFLSPHHSKVCGARTAPPPAPHDVKPWQWLRGHTWITKHRLPRSPPPSLRVRNLDHLRVMEWLFVLPCLEMHPSMVR